MVIMEIVMTDLAATQEDTPLEPIAYSADGKRNSYTLSCTPTGQSMNYAACIWRQKVLDNPKTVTPPDWNTCKEARDAGRCIALQMRQEEELAGKSIYFRCRKALSEASIAAREWIMPGSTTRGGAPRRPAPAPAAKPKTMLDAMGSMGDLGDAISAAAATPASPPPAVRAPIPIMPVAQSGESPLQMARRIAAERAANA